MISHGSILRLGRLWTEIPPTLSRSTCLPPYPFPIWLCTSILMNAYARSTLLTSTKYIGSQGTKFGMRIMSATAAIPENLSNIERIDFKSWKHSNRSIKNRMAYSYNFFDLQYRWITDYDGRYWREYIWRSEKSVHFQRNSVLPLSKYLKTHPTWLLDW